VVIKENKTMYVILGLLSHEDMTGYDIKKRIDISLKLFWDAGFGQIYPSLRTLEKGGLVKCQNQTSDTGPDRILYSITEEGRKALNIWLLKPVEKEQVKYEILLKLFFGSVIEPKENLKNIREFKERNSNTLALLQGFKKQLEQVLEQDKDHIYYYLTVLFGEKVYKAYLEWADEATEILGRVKDNNKD